jgi:hypothetical protein
VRNDAQRHGLLSATALFAALAVASVPLPAQTVAGARVFLAAVYSHYQHGGKGVDFTGPNAALYFHSSLLALIRADIKASGPDEVPTALDADPVCACQDWDGIWDLKIDIHLEAPRRARANVSFWLWAPNNRANDTMRQLAISLVPERGVWRLYDIEDDSDSSTTFALRKLIQDDIATIRKEAGGEANH